MHIKPNNSIIGVVLILLATLLLSFRSILVKLAYTENISLMDLFYFRFLFTVPLLFCFAFYQKGKKLFSTILNKDIFLYCALAGFFGYYLATLSDFHSLQLINANINRIILYSFPIYVLIFNSIISKKLPSNTEILSFILVQLFLLFVLGGTDIKLLSSISKSGVFLALLAAISYSIYIIINQQVGKKIGSILFTTYAIIFSFLFINVHFWFSFQESQPITKNGWIMIIIMAIFCTFLPLLLISEGIKRIGAQRFALLNTAGPVMTIILCFVILNETMTLQQIIGSVMVITILYFSERMKAL